MVSTLRSGWITTGPRTKLFEEKFRDYIGSKYAIAVNSCTAALHLALIANDVGQNDEVITTPYTFAASAEVIIHSNAVPKFIDIESDGFNIDPDIIEAEITPRTKAIIPVHFAGEPCKMDEILQIARQYNLIVIEDAAHALGAIYKDKKIGALGTTTCFSFYATKNMTTGEGGMLTTDDEELAERIRLLSLHGLSGDAWKRYSKEGNWYYEILEPGFKYNLSDIQAAIGLKQLEKFDELQQKRKNLVHYYQECLSDIDELLLPPTPSFAEHAWHLFVIRLHTEKTSISRDVFIKLLNENGIGTSVHFIPLHLHPYYQNQYGYKLGDFPNAEKTYLSSISLPLYPQMTFADVDFITNIIRDIMARNRRRTTIYIPREGVC